MIFDRLELKLIRGRHEVWEFWAALFQGEPS